MLCARHKDMPDALTHQKRYRENKMNKYAIILVLLLGFCSCSFNPVGRYRAVDVYRPKSDRDISHVMLEREITGKTKVENPEIQKWLKTIPPSPKRKTGFFLTLTDKTQEKSEKPELRSAYEVDGFISGCWSYNSKNRDVINLFEIAHFKDPEDQVVITSIAGEHITNWELKRVGNVYELSAKIPFSNGQRYKIILKKEKL